MTTFRPINQIAEVRAGLSIAGKIEHDPLARYQLIVPKHLDEDGRPFVYDGERHALRMALTERAPAYAVVPGDVLLVARGERNRAVAVQSCPENSICGSSSYLLRPIDGTVLPDYLAWVLNQAPAQAAIAQIRTGAGTPMVPRADFEQIQIPVPPLDVQRRLADLGGLMLQEQSLHARLEQAVLRRNRLIGKALLERTNDSEDQHG